LLWGRNHLQIWILILVFTTYFTKLSRNIAKFLKVFGLNYRFCNPVYSASLCLIPHSLMLSCLVWKMTFPDYLFFRDQHFWRQHRAQSRCRVRCVIKKLAFSFTCWNFIADFQGATELQVHISVLLLNQDSLIGVYDALFTPLNCRDFCVTKL